MTAPRRAAALSLVLVAACGRDAVLPAEYPVDPDALPPETQFLAEIDRTKGVRDCFTVVRDGRFVPAAEAPRMQPGERVLGLDLGEVQFAYPLRYLNFHEIVEHTAAGQDLLVCW